jgi:hypothetical protein
MNVIDEIVALKGEVATLETATGKARDTWHALRADAVLSLRADSAAAATLADTLDGGTCRWGADVSKAADVAVASLGARFDNWGVLILARDAFAESEAALSAAQARWLEFRRRAAGNT